MPVALLLCKVTVLLAAAWGAARVFRSQSADLRHRVWTLALASSLILPLLGATLPGWRPAAVGRAFAQVTGSLARAPIEHSLPPMEVKALPARITPADVVLFMWIAGCSIMLLRFIRGLVALAWLSSRAKPILEDRWMWAVLNVSRRLGITRAVRLLESRQPQSMPLTWGFLRPAILLPSDAHTWDDERRDLVLAHELSHVARADWPVQIVAEFARAVYWFHPLAWIAADRLRQESERAADDAVLNSGVRPSDYASQLLDLARTLKNADRVWSTALAMARTSNLERRFIAMLNPSINRRRTSRRAALFTTFAAIALLLPLAALKSPAQDRAGRFTGTVLDPRNTAIANATIIMTNPKTQTKDMTTSDAAGKYSFAGLPAGDYQMTVLQPGFAPYTGTVVLGAGQDFSQDVPLLLGAVNEHIEVTGGSGPARIRVGGNVQAAKLLRKVAPIYPAAAKQAGIQGSVMLQALIGKDGTLSTLRVLNSQVDPELAKSAVEAVSQWVYQSTLLNGEPVEVATNIVVNFTLNP